MNVPVGFMMIVTGTLLVNPASVIQAFSDSEELRQTCRGVLALGCWLLWVGGVIYIEPSHGPWYLAWNVIVGSLTMLNTWLWWKNRRKGRGKKALRQLGDKSRSLIKAMTRRLTPSPIKLRVPVRGAG